MVHPATHPADPMQLWATVSGSFHRFMPEVGMAVGQLRALGLEVLSPAHPIIVAADGDFLYVASDLVRSIRRVQDRHNTCIQRSDLLWLVNPGGYVGLSASLEIGVALASGVPVYTLTKPKDVTLAQYVQVVNAPAQAVGYVTSVLQAAAQRHRQYANRRDQLRRIPRPPVKAWVGLLFARKTQAP